jgi:hypothetical protein
LNKFKYFLGRLNKFKNYKISNFQNFKTCSEFIELFKINNLNYKFMSKHLSFTSKLCLGLALFLVSAVLVQATTNYITYQGTPTEKFILDNNVQINGNVGIGTTSLGYKLSVVDTGTVPMINIWNNSATNQWTGTRLARGGTGDGTEKWFIGMNATNNNLIFRRAGSNDDLVIDTNGNISGNGSGLTSLNASNLSSGTVPAARISGSYTGITGVGTIGAGTWQGTSISTSYTSAQDTSADDWAGNSILNWTLSGANGLFTNENELNTKNGPLHLQHTDGSSGNAGSGVYIDIGDLHVAGTIFEGGTLLSGKYLGISANAVSATTAATATNADILDTHHASDFLLTTGKAANSDLLDNIDSTGFLSTSGGTISGNLTVTGNLGLGFQWVNAVSCTSCSDPDGGGSCNSNGRAEQVSVSCPAGTKVITGSCDHSNVSRPMDIDRVTTDASNNPTDGWICRIECDGGCCDGASSSITAWALCARRS